MEELRNAIERIVSEVPTGCIFDSHYVISMLQRKYPDLYLQYASDEMNNWHSQISTAIRGIEKIEQVKEKSFSINLKQNPSENAAWKKIG